MRKVRPLEQVYLACWREKRNTWHDPRLWLLIVVSFVTLSVLGFKIGKAAKDAADDWRERDIRFSKDGLN